MNGSVQSEGAVLRRPFVSRRFSPLLFAAILIAFALPFATVSCKGPPVEFTGYELAAWKVDQTSPPATTDDGKSLPKAIEGKASFWADLVLMAAVIGFGLGLAGRRGAGICATLGLVGIAFLFGQLFQPLGPDIETGLGFELAAGLYLALGVWHAAFAIGRRSARRAEAGALSPWPPSGMTETKRDHVP